MVSHVINLPPPNAALEKTAEVPPLQEEKSLNPWKPHHHCLIFSQFCVVGNSDRISLLRIVSPLSKKRLFFVREGMVECEEEDDDGTRLSRTGSTCALAAGNTSK